PAVGGRLARGEKGPAVWWVHADVRGRSGRRGSDRFRWPYVGCAGRKSLARLAILALRPRAPIRNSVAHTALSTGGRRLLHKNEGREEMSRGVAVRTDLPRPALRASRACPVATTARHDRRSDPASDRIADSSGESSLTMAATFADVRARTTAV